VVNIILLLGVGFFAGILLSIGLIDYMYKGQLRKAIDEIDRQYCIALGIMEKRIKEELQGKE